MQSETDQVLEGETPDRKPRHSKLGLSSRLFFLTILFILLAEALIFLPSLANFRLAWLNERVEMAQTSVITLEAMMEPQVSDELSRNLLEQSNIVAVVSGSQSGRELILSPAMEISGDVEMVDLRRSPMLPDIFGTLQTVFDPDIRFFRVLEDPRFDGDFVEVIVEAAPLRAAMFDYAKRIIGLSLFISTFVGFLIYLSLLLIVVRPIRRITKSIERFRNDPRDWKSRILPTPRRDEIGRAQNALSDMEGAVKSAMRERERLAGLGEAMAKINHDLRNSLTAAQIVSDGLTLSTDPRVQRTAPRLERAIERAITLAENTLQYGRAEPPQPKLERHALRQIIEEAAYEALAEHADLMWINDVEDGVELEIDLDHLHRIIVNLIRNAAQAIAADKARKTTGRISIRSRAEMSRTHIEVIDDGPGIPAKIQESLFRPFSASGSRNGSGLGLAIARELATGMGGELKLVRTNAEGTVFELILGGDDEDAPSE